MLLYLIFSLLLTTHQHLLYCFNSLSDLQNYTAIHPEYPPSDNNAMNPDYTAYYHTLNPNIFVRTLRFLGIASHPLWQPQQLSTLLEEYLTQHSSLVEDYSHQHTDSEHQTNVVHVHPQEQTVHFHLDHETRFFIWTDLYADIHSLTRSLAWLHEHDIIDEQFHIKSDHDYFVFNGNCIDLGPYSLEMLTILLLLIKNNHDHVIYIQGKHEHNNHWIDFGLKRELLARAYNLSSEAIPLQASISKFFAQLPLLVTLSTTHNLQKYIRIISEVTPNEIFKAQNISLETQAIITDENWIKYNRNHNGLTLLSQEEGATTWALLSAPAVPLRSYYNFVYDAFAVLTVPNHLSQSTITLYNHDTTKNEGFIIHPEKNIITGMPIDNAQQKYDEKNDLLIGSTSSLEQGVVVMGQYTKLGLDTRINQENIKGGINGHHIRSIIYNDDYTPYLSRLNINRLLKQDHTDIIIAPIGSPTLESYINYVRKNKILVLFPITGGPQFRTPDLKGIVHFRASYADEVRALIDHMYTEYGARKFAFFYQNDAYGIGPLKAAHKALQKRGITKWVDIPYSRVSLNFKEQAEKIMVEQPDAIGMLSTTNPTEELIRQVGIDALANKKMFGISFLDEKSFREFLTVHGLSLLFASVVPNPKMSQIELVKEYRALMDSESLPYDIFSLEAYIAASIFIDTAKKIKGPITKDTIRTSLESLQNYDFKGFTLTFNPEQRSLARYIWIETGPDKEWIQTDIATTTT